MDLTLFIVFIVFSFILYYLVISIQSLVKELREVKNKCIAGNNAKSEDFTVDTPDPATLIKQKTVNMLSKVQNIFSE